MGFAAVSHDGQSTCPGINLGYAYLNRQSGLKGIFGDMRQIMNAIAEGNSRAQLAFDLYIHRLRSEIGAMLTSLGGLDALVFTGGIGENHPQLRQLACEALEFLGLKINSEKNSQSPPDEDIATADSSVQVLIVPAQEDWAIAQECWKLVEAKD